ncbi:glutamate receptor ionotropic, NMDA 2D-like [Clupea harengus]|uniref:Glutamate receptor ionotropic, NMDA 2D-like n=1 Tax=Clupea harengus TaxID=7950 RepID=A0A6P8ESV1_CLUHA|nr:glutamate receptor ionotropic, NMDA 2D-like [Clupea harengus]
MSKPRAKPPPRLPTLRDEKGLDKLRDGWRRGYAARASALRVCVCVRVRVCVPRCPAPCRAAGGGDPGPDAGAPGPGATAEPGFEPELYPGRFAVGDGRVEAHVVALGLNRTDPRSVLTGLCDLMGRQPLHGLVFGDDGHQDAPLAQLLDFVSAHTLMPIVGIHGGSAMTMAQKNV